MGRSDTMGYGSMGSLYLGVSGLQTSQTALNVTAHNMANVDTPGYVRQQIVQTSSEYFRYAFNPVNDMTVGSGTAVSVVRQVRNEFIDRQYRQELGRQSFYEERAKAVSEIQGYFGEMEGATFQGIISNLWSSMVAVQEEPDSIVARRALIQSSVTFIERAKQINDSLNKYQENLNVQILDKVNEINKLGERIGVLNQEIAKVELAGVEKANDLRDERNLCLDELSKLIDISYTERGSGVEVMAEGKVFVSPVRVYRLDVEQMSGSNMYNVVWRDHAGEDVFHFWPAPSAEDNTDTGSLKALLYTRGMKDTNYTDIPTKPKAEDFADPAAYQAALTQYNQDVDTYDKEVSNYAVANLQAQFDQLMHSMVTAINDVFCPNTTASFTVKDPVTGNVTTYNNVKVLDLEKAPIGMDQDAQPGVELFKRASMDRYTKVEGEDGNTYYIYNEEDKSNTYSLYTVGELEVNPEVLADNGSKLPLSNNDRTGAYDQKVADQLIDIWRDTGMFLGPHTLTPCNFNDYYAAMIGDLGNRGMEYINISNSQASVTNDLNNERLKTAGTSSDEELSNMIKFQHAYNAAARYVNVVSEMLDLLVNQLGR